ncbi:MAG: hypothetical protein JOY51_06985 [Nevskia sp.]|nr:hypothetical protein [Nevskia sp.]
MRNNLVEGEYDWSLANSASGIQLIYGATPDSAAPPVLGYGVSVAGNTIDHADTAYTYGGANLPLGGLGLGPSGSTGPLDASGVSGWKMADASLLFHNTLSNIAYTASDGLSRLGIGLDRAPGTSSAAPIAWRSVLYGNSCSNNVPSALAGTGTGTIYYCPAGAASCGCSGTPGPDVGVQAGSPQYVPTGTAVTWSAQVHNYGNSNATGVVLALEPPRGVHITSLSTPNGYVPCDMATYTCALGTLAPGASVLIQADGTTSLAGTWPLLFSVSHQEVDPNVLNNTSEVDITVTLRNGGGRRSRN